MEGPENIAIRGRATDELLPRCHKGGQVIFRKQFTAGVSLAVSPLSAHRAECGSGRKAITLLDSQWEGSVAEPCLVFPGHLPSHPKVTSAPPAHHLASSPLPWEGRQPITLLYFGSHLNHSRTCQNSRASSSRGQGFADL